MKKVFIIFVSLVLGSALFCAVPSVASSEYPKKSITIIYPWNPGGAAEIDARAAASFLESKFKVRVLVTNKVGGADIEAGGSLLTLTVIAFFSHYETGHKMSPHSISQELSKSWDM